MYKYILSMYWYEHFQRVSSRVSGFQMAGACGGGGARARRQKARAPRRQYLGLNLFCLNLSSLQLL